MYLGKADVNTYDKGAGREFLVSNGRGGYGFSTVIGANTRREHGLLVVRPENERQHSVLVSKIEETVFDSNKKYQLSTNRYRDLVYPDGYRYLQEYQGNPFPTMLFVIHSILLKKSIFMPHGKECTIVKYELLAAPGKIRLDLRPLFAHRKNSEVCLDSGKNVFSVSSDDAHGICVTGRGHSSCCAATAGTWALKPLWFENLIYEQDDNSDGACVDHLWSPGLISNEMSEGDSVYMILSEKAEKFTLKELGEIESEAAQRFEDILEQANIPAFSSAEQDMVASSYHLVDDRPESIAPIYTGYPSVDTKASDTFIALPGLLLATGREKTAAKTLKYWSGVAESCGWAMPEKLSDDGEPEFGCIDCGLWFVYAIDKYLSHHAEADPDDKERLTKALFAVTDKYLSEIDELDVKCADNMLLQMLGADPARYWMSAVAGEEVVVPRCGYLVEVNALWYNALKCAEKYACGSGNAESAERYKNAAEKCGKSFCDTFWSCDMNGLYDYVDPETFKGDGAIRPNQILAASLPFSPLSPEAAQSVVRLCWNTLYTTYGLRTLDPRHDKFKGRSEGRLDQRLKARFRGMAWPWLLGEFITAYLKYNPTRKDLGWVFMRPFNSHLRHGCLCGVAQLFDGIMPYRPHGDVLSACALGELLRVLHENLEPNE
ncbi:amylo-alpha-1,6-glucosidase [Synergistes jonesii]|uniref:amylo-alpha-1,6-glucosidase n=1 Tax=Synergistes jonesii TaxID=2754 RepID=UPI00248E044A|nr:amylo-alpha-1,6-glucosidase [Synergistes jonesii]